MLNQRTYKLVFIRHGESLWNHENRFTGWEDVALSETGRKEAVAAGKALLNLRTQNQHDFGRVFTSVLKRAIQTMNLALEQMDREWLPITKDWHLNERHYGALTGLNKAETAAKHGEEQVKIWRRSYDVPPPAMDLDDARHPKNDLRYKSVPQKQLPNGESLKMTVERVAPFWDSVLKPSLLAGENPLVVAHGNSLRALIQLLEKLTPDQIMEVNVPTGIPLMLELDENLKVLRKQYLGDADTVKAAMDKVAAQGKAKH